MLSFKKFIVHFCIVLVSSTAFGQVVTLENRNQTLVIKNSGTKVQSSEETSLRNISNYKIYKLVDPDKVTIHAEVHENIQVRSFEGTHNFQTWLKLELTNPIKFGETYLLEIVNAKWDGKPIPLIRFKLDKKVAAKTLNNPREAIYLEGKTNLSASGVEVKETVLKVDRSKKKLLISPTTIDVETPIKDSVPTEMTVYFKKPLNEARNHRLQIKVASDDGTELLAKTTVKIPALAPESRDADVDFSLSSEFGGGLKPQFNLAGVVKKQFVESKNRHFVFAPVAKFDIGLGATKSKNAIVIDFPSVKDTWMTRRFSKGYCEKPLKQPTLKSQTRTPAPLNSEDAPQLTDGKNHEVDLPCYSEWNSRNPLTLYSIDFSAGPKVEMDRALARISLLGKVQFDFNFDRWQHSISNQRDFLELDLESDLQFSNNGHHKDVIIPFGYKITPRFGFELGRKLTGEVIKNKDESIRHNIDPFPIFRTYTGVTGVFEWNKFYRPIKLTINQDLFYFAYQENSGELSDGILTLRNIKGFHPYGKAVLDIGLDPAARINFSFSWENGRAAPDFEYLNTIKSGIRFVY